MHSLIASILTGMQLHCFARLPSHPWRLACEKKVDAQPLHHQIKDGGFKGFLVMMVSVVLSGCAAPQMDTPFFPNPREYDQFRPLPIKERAIDIAIVEWIVTDDALNICKKLIGVAGMNTLGCAVWNVKNKRCTIYTPNVTTHVVLGHDLRHCFEGQFHPKRQWN